MVVGTCQKRGEQGWRHNGLEEMHHRDLDVGDWECKVVWDRVVGGRLCGGGGEVGCVAVGMEVGVVDVDV